MASKEQVTKKNRYRLIVINHETLEKLRSFTFTKNQFLLGFLALPLLFLILSWVLFAFTPIGGFIQRSTGTNKEKRNLVEISQELRQLENTVRAQNKYIQSIQRLITKHDFIEKDHEDDITDTEIASQEEGVPLVLLPEIDEIEANDDLSVQKPAYALKPIEELYLVPPLKGYISAVFLKERKHLGTDIVAAPNTPIKSILNGHVIMSDWTINTGYSMGIQHGHGLVSFYKHNSALLKKIGDFVVTGEVIAIIGNTGELSTGPHLHFELWREGKPVNPNDYISFE